MVDAITTQHKTVVTMQEITKIFHWNFAMFTSFAPAVDSEKMIVFIDKEVLSSFKCTIEFSGNGCTRRNYNANGFRFGVFKTCHFDLFLVSI